MTTGVKDRWYTVEVCVCDGSFFCFFECVTDGLWCIVQCTLGGLNLLNQESDDRDAG